ncbi:MAG: phospho-N-acetylmuramoyl-pentapeptide-transferase [Planctomycetota bacterium]
MLYYLSTEIFRHLSLRIAGAAITAFLMGLALVPLVIRYGRRRGFKDREGKTHSIKLNELHAKKKDTPVLGGLAILAASLGAMALWAKVLNFYVLLMAGTLVALGTLGLTDDFVKTFGRDKKEGLTPKQKLFAQIGVGLAIGALLVLFYDGFTPLGVSPTYAATMATAEAGSDASVAVIADTAPAAVGRDMLGLTVPCTKWTIPLGAFLFVAFTTLVITGSSNAVNLTDGLDGLAGGCFTLAIVVQGVFAYVASRADWCADLGLQHVPGAGEVAVCCAALAGGTIAFVWFNAHPAELFMGDAGSLPLGGSIALVAIITKHELLLPFVAIVFVAEALSVMAQVAFFKLTKKRLLACAPLHHHFEFQGWPETKVVIRFWIVAGLAALASLATLAVRS